MQLSFRRVYALFKKEAKDFWKNPNTLLMYFLPLVTTAIYTYLLDVQDGKVEILFLVMGVNFLLVSSFIMASLIAEEKEKNTMRTLMLSSVSPLEFLLGKATLVLLVSILNKLFMYYMLGLDMQFLGIYILLSLLVIIIMIIIGAIIGLIAQNQLATGVVGMPVLLIFMFIPILSQANEGINKMASLLPNVSLHLILERTLIGQPFHLFSKNFLIIVVWMVLAVITFVYTYNKKGLDN